MNAHEAAKIWSAGEWTELTSPAKYEAIEALVAYHDEAQIMVNGLLGAMTTQKQQVRWRNIIARSRRLITIARAICEPPEDA